MINKFELLKKELEEILPNSPVREELMHSKLVLKWLLKLKSDADEALQIAALSHDIDRAISKITEKDLKDYSKIHDFKKEHAIRSASYISEIMKKHNYSNEIINRVKHLVENHEVGGDEDTNILTDADSLAYFEYNIPFYLIRNGKERTKEKIKFMYKRLSFEKSKGFVNQMNFEKLEIRNLVRESLSEL
jgi:hypothetical protein